MRFAWVAVGAGLLAVAACSPATARPAADGHGRPHVVTVAREGRDRMELDVVSGATTVAISSANLGHELMRAATPANSGVTPDLVVGRANTGVAGGRMLPLPVWASAPSRYDIDAPAGVSAISVTSR